MMCRPLRLRPLPAASSCAHLPLCHVVFLPRSRDTHTHTPAPPPTCTQAGFPVSKRLVNFVYKGFIFSLIGLMAGTVGTSLSNGLLALRQHLDPSFVVQNEPPTVLGNASCWALHMGISSNLRYQLLGGADGVSVATLVAGRRVHAEQAQQCVWAL